MTVSQFRKSSPLTAGLGEIMSNPTMKAALDAIKEEAIMRAPPPSVAGVHQDTVTAHHVYRQFGIMYVIDTLHRMTREGAEHEPEEDEFSEVEKQFQEYKIKTNTQ